jgi:hypothetical protein
MVRMVSDAGRTSKTTKPKTTSPAPTVPNAGALAGAGAGIPGGAGAAGGGTAGKTALRTSGAIGGANLGRRSSAPVGGGVGGFSGGGAGSAVASSTGAVGTAAPPSDDDWWNQDAAYQAQLGGIESNKQSALANLLQQRQNYDTDLGSTLKNLGRKGSDINQWEGGGGLGEWDPTNMQGAYGQGLFNLQNDFSSRGLADSSFYNTALGDFNNDMNNQFNNLVQARGAFGRARGQDEFDANAAYTNALNQARAESIARRAAQYGV